MAISTQPPAYQNRNAAFSTGHSGAPTESAGLAQQQQAENAASHTTGVKPSGSGNGMSATQGSNTINGMLQDTGIGSAADTYQNKKWFEPRR